MHSKGFGDAGDAFTWVEECTRFSLESLISVGFLRGGDLRDSKDERGGQHLKKEVKEITEGSSSV